MKRGNALALAGVCAIAAAASRAWAPLKPKHGQRRGNPGEAADHAALRARIDGYRQVVSDLEQAKKSAETANDAKTRYLVAVSHEIRSPLNAIYGYSQLLERGGVVEAAEAGRVIRRSSEHLANLVEGLLEISRIESGLIRISRETVPFVPLVEQLTDMFRSQAAGKGIDLRFVADGRLPVFVRTDEKRLRQIIINLLSNAIKYTDRGFVELRIAYRSQTAFIDVIDSGLGIRVEDRERIFEPFERGGSPDTLSRPGIGLGLTITRSLARIMGGELTLRSEPGRGSCFTLRLLLPEPMDAPSATARSQTITGYEGRRRTLLLVDDDPAQLAVLQGLFGSLGFDVHAAAGGPEGLDLAASNRPDLALLDIQMQDMTGWQVAAALRANHGEALQIVMVSANALDFAVGRPLGGDDGLAVHDSFVLKPVDLNLLLDVVATRLGLTWTAHPPAPVEPRRDLLPTPALTTPVQPTPVQPTPSEAAPFLAELHRLGSIGHVRGITAKLDAMAEAVPAARSLVARLRSLIDSFDLKAFIELVEESGLG